jgi:hypothetical protein
MNFEERKRLTMHFIESRENRIVNMINDGEIGPESIENVVIDIPEYDDIQTICEDDTDKVIKELIREENIVRYKYRSGIKYCTEFYEFFINNILRQFETYEKIMKDLEFEEDPLKE